VVKIKPDRVSWVILENLYAFHILHDKMAAAAKKEATPTGSSGRGGGAAAAAAAAVARVDPLTELKSLFYRRESTSIVPLGTVKEWLLASLKSTPGFKEEEKEQIEKSLSLEGESTVPTADLCAPSDLPAGAAYSTLPTPEVYHFNNLHALIQGLGGTDVMREFLSNLLGHNRRDDVYNTPPRNNSRPHSAPTSFGRSPSVERK
jgi:hypothetical protein